MPPDETIADAIESTAMGPASVSIDGTSVQAQDLDKLIRADQHKAGKTAATRNHFGLRFAKTRPPGGGL